MVVTAHDTALVYMTDQQLRQSLSVIRVTYICHGGPRSVAHFARVTRIRTLTSTVAMMIVGVGGDGQCLYKL